MVRLVVTPTIRGVRDGHGPGAAGSSLPRAWSRKLPCRNLLRWSASAAVRAAAKPPAHRPTMTAVRWKQVTHRGAARPGYGAGRRAGGRAAPSGPSGPGTGTSTMPPPRSGAPSAATDGPTLRCVVPVRPRTFSAVEPCPGRQGESGRVYDPYLQRNQGIATDPFRFPRSAGGPCPASTGRLGSPNHDDEPRGPRELGHDEVPAALEIGDQGRHPLGVARRP